jgi:hypothetical protein
VTFALWLRLPLVPVIVSVELPLLPPAVTVRVDVDPVGLGEKDAVAPAGRPLTLSVTCPEKPFVGVTVTVYVVLPDDRMNRNDGETLIEKSPAGALWTTRVVVTEWLRLPLVPVTVSVELPAGVLLEVVTVQELVPEVSEAGLQLAPPPLGKPLTPRLTVPLKPPAGVTVTV